MNNAVIPTEASNITLTDRILKQLNNKQIREILKNYDIRQDTSFIKWCIL